MEARGKDRCKQNCGWAGKAQLCLRLGLDSNIAINKRATGKPPVGWLAFEHNFLFRGLFVQVLQAFFDGHEAGSALTTASTIPELPTQGVDVDLLFHKSSAEIFALFDLDDRATIALRDLDGERLGLDGACKGRRGWFGCDRARPWRRLGRSAAAGLGGAGVIPGRSQRADAGDKGWCDHRILRYSKLRRTG
jgi:hypothetical protein